MRPILERFAPTTAVRNKDRPPPEGYDGRAFFDLVYVFTIIQLSHYLLEHQTWLGAIEAATLFAGVWWAWNYTAWASN